MNLSLLNNHVFLNRKSLMFVPSDLCEIIPTCTHWCFVLGWRSLQVQWLEKPEPPSYTPTNWPAVQCSQLAGAMQKLLSYFGYACQLKGRKYSFAVLPLAYTFVIMTAVFFSKVILFTQGDHVTHLENISEEEMNRLLGIVLDVEYLYTCVHKEEDADTKQVYFSLFKVSL